MKITQDQIIKTIEMYSGGKPIKEICLQVGIGKTSIRRILNKHNIKLKNPNKNIRYQINENLFQTINNEKNAYILGFLYADGYVSKNHNFFCLSQTEKEKDILQKINNAIYKSHHPLKMTVPKPSKYNSAPYYSMTVSNKKMTLDLINKGCVPSKSFRLKFPNEIVPKSIMWHFIRGYFDGDGCISKSSKQITLNMAGCEIFIKQLHAFILEKNGIKSSLCKHKSGIWYLRIHNLKDLKKIYDVMYKNSTLFMSRKHDKIKLILKNSNLKNMTSKHQNISCDKNHKWRFSKMINGKLTQSQRFNSEIEAIKFKSKFVKTHDYS